MLVSGLLLLSLTGCGGSGEKKDIVPAGTSAAETQTEDKDAGKTEEPKEPKTITIEREELVNEKGITITAVEYVTDSIWGDGVKLLLENSGEQNVIVSCRALIVNNYMIPDFFSETVAAGKKSNATVYLSTSELKAAGIDTVGQIEIYFHIYDENTWDEVLDTDAVTIRTSAYEDMDTVPDDAGMELLNEGGIRIVGKTVDEDSFWGTSVLLFIENQSGRNVSVHVDDMSINGFMVDGLFYADLYDGKMIIDNITVLSSDLEANDIESIDEVELSFRVSDLDTYETILESGPVIFGAQG